MDNPFKVGKQLGEELAAREEIDSLFHKWGIW
jgi:hypothetical protein